MKSNDIQDEDYEEEAFVEEQGIGRAVAILFAGCISVVVIAVTVRLARWIIGF